MSWHCLTVLLTQDLVNSLTECICTGFALYSSRRGQGYYEVACHLIDFHAVEKIALKATVPSSFGTFFILVSHLAILF